MSSMRGIRDMERLQRIGRYRRGKLPRDFPQRLEFLKETSGLSWKALSRRLGVSYQRVRRWRGGSEPTGGAMLALFQLASEVPGGMEALVPEEAELLRRGV